MDSIDSENERGEPIESSEARIRILSAYCDQCKCEFVPVTLPLQLFRQAKFRCDHCPGQIVMTTEPAN